jgi:hypothetical protein
LPSHDIWRELNKLKNEQIARDLNRNGRIFISSFFCAAFEGHKIGINQEDFFYYY